jgi:hypothetical protein
MTTKEKLVHFCPDPKVKARLSALLQVALAKPMKCFGCGEIRDVPKYVKCECGACYTSL